MINNTMVSGAMLSKMNAGGHVLPSNCQRNQNGMCEVQRQLSDCVYNMDEECEYVENSNLYMLRAIFDGKSGI